MKHTFSFTALVNDLTDEARNDWRDEYQREKSRRVTSVEQEIKDIIEDLSTMEDLINDNANQLSVILSENMYCAADLGLRLQLYMENVIEEKAQESINYREQI